MSVVGYRCCGCGEAFYHEDYENKQAMKAAVRHTEAHNTGAEITPIVDRG